MLGGPRLRQHTVEFIIGTGIVTDGVVNASSTASPFAWTVPDGVAEVTIDMITGGPGGSGGAAAGTNVSLGGAGSGCSSAMMRWPLAVIPGQVYAATVGAGQAGAAIANWLGGPAMTSFVAAGYSATTMSAYSLAVLVGSIQGGGSGSGALSGSSGSGGSNGGFYGFQNGGGTAGGFGNGSAVQAYSMGAGYLLNIGGGSGGAGATSASVAGGGGGGNMDGGAGNPNLTRQLFAGALGGNGTTSGTVSYGGGGAGCSSPFGIGGAGGNGNAAGANAPATSYGAGGGGGGGNGAGGNGANGYIRLTYWSMD